MWKTAWSCRGSSSDALRSPVVSAKAGTAEHGVVDAAEHSKLSGAWGFGSRLAPGRQVCGMCMTSADLRRLNVDWLHNGALARLLAVLDRDGEEARVVGGAVRNALLGVPLGD